MAIITSIEQKTDKKYTIEIKLNHLKGVKKEWLV